MLLDVADLTNLPLVTSDQSLLRQPGSALGSQNAMPYDRSLPTWSYTAILARFQINTGEE